VHDIKGLTVKSVFGDKPPSLVVIVFNGLAELNRKGNHND